MLWNSLNIWLEFLWNCPNFGFVHDRISLWHLLLLSFKQVPIYIMWVTFNLTSIDTKCDGSRTFRLHYHYRLLGYKVLHWQFNWVNACESDMRACRLRQMKGNDVKNWIQMNLCLFSLPFRWHLFGLNAKSNINTICGRLVFGKICRKHWDACHQRLQSIRQHHCLAHAKVSVNFNFTFFYPF